MAYEVKPRESDPARGLSLALILAFIFAGIGIWLFSCARAHAAEINYRSPPPGFFACAYVRHDRACTADPEAARAIPENPALQKRIARVNAAVNGALWKYECADIGHNGPDGEPNYWASYDPAHPTFTRRACVNCINYAATKRRVLLADGLPANALRYAHVRYRWSPAMTHIILLLYTNAHQSDPLVLDSAWFGFNSPNTVSRWSQVGPYYNLLEIQDAHGAWRKAS